MSDEKPDDLKERWQACCWSPEAERSGDAQISLKPWLRPRLLTGFHRGDASCFMTLLSQLFHFVDQPCTGASHKPLFDLGNGKRCAQ